MFSRELKSDPIWKVIRYVPLSKRSDVAPQKRYGAYRIRSVPCEQKAYLVWKVIRYEMNPVWNDPCQDLCGLRACFLYIKSDKDSVQGCLLTLIVLIASKISLVTFNPSDHCTCDIFSLIFLQEFLDHPSDFPTRKYSLSDKHFGHIIGPLKMRAKDKIKEAL